MLPLWVQARLSGVQVQGSGLPQVWKNSHIAKVCRSKQQKRLRPKGGASACSHMVHVLVSGEEADNETDGVLSIRAEPRAIGGGSLHQQSRAAHGGASASMVSEYTYHTV